MKLVSAKSAGGRNVMRERQRRDRASTPALRIRFPDIETLRLEFSFTDRGPFTPAPQVTVMHPPASAYFLFPCPYMDCDGEFDLSETVARLTDRESSRCHGQIKCGGHRRVDVGSVPCSLTLEYSIEAHRRG